MLSILILVSPLLAFVAAAELFYSDLQPCPAVCEPGSNLSDWTFYHDVNRLAVCDQPVLLDFNVYTPVDDPCTDVTMRACTVANTTTDTLCDCDCEDASSMETSENVIVATRRLQDYLRNDAHSSRKILFAAHRGSLVGVYLGPFKYNESRAADTLMPKFVDNIKRDGVGNRTALQICSQGSSSDQVLGIAADAKGDFAAIQSIMKSWDEAQCITGDEASDWDGIETWSVQDDGLSGRDIVERSIYFDKHDSSLAPNHRLGIRADCRTLKVLSGDTCTSLASKCGVEAAAFTRYNSNSTTLCSSLQVGQAVCCSAGTLPDIKPKPQTDGTCAVHTVESNEYCQSIAASYGLSLQDLDDFNKETWGWLGCDNLQVNTRICVSTGNAPMPAPVSNAVCGPIVPGTKAPAENQSIADLNPCILNACCNVWGQCGTTAEFCTETASVTGNPGTSEPGANGCMHSCGTDIVNNGTAPSQFRKIGYFEAWNLERDCLQMHVARIKPAQSYTHVHFAFAQISTDFQVVIASNLTQQWDAFRTASSSYKKVLAFGGWSFSTDYDTRAIFAQGVSASNRALFADRVVQFVAANGLDGLDFDWEYPGATDIPGAPAGHKDDGNNYLEFLKLVRAKLPSEKTLSIAIPASFWYLRGFPVAQLADVVDYVVYMTYDLHGKWVMFTFYDCRLLRLVHGSGS